MQKGGNVITSMEEGVRRINKVNALLVATHSLVNNMG